MLSGKILYIIKVQNFEHYLKDILGYLIWTFRNIFHSSNKQTKTLFDYKKSHVKEICVEWF
jgi:hypothetical protein